MGIGASIFLIAIGAILAFAVNADLGGVDINVIGWILMVVGALGLVMTALIWGRRRTVVDTAPVLGACGKPSCRDGAGEAVGFAVLLALTGLAQRGLARNEMKKLE